MRIVRYMAPDTRQALRGIREQLGDDAVILSSKRTPEGVEVTAAVDFDATRLENASVGSRCDTRSRDCAHRRAAAYGLTGACHHGCAGRLTYAGTRCAPCSRTRSSAGCAPCCNTARASA